MGFVEQPSDVVEDKELCLGHDASGNQEAHQFP
jgi:hypothetical protein